MKKNAAKVTLALVAALVMIVGVVSPVAAKPVRTFQIDNQELVDYTTPYRLRAEASFEGYGAYGYKYMWRKDMGGGNFQTFAGSTGGPIFFAEGRLTSGNIEVLGPGGQTPGRYQFTLWLVGKNGRPIRRLGFAQSTATLFTYAEDFTGYTLAELPPGWTGGGNYTDRIYVDHWNGAGGSAPELEFTWGSEVITETYYIYTPSINATIATNTLELSFKHFHEYYTDETPPVSPPYSIAVDVSTDGGVTWGATSFAYSPTADIGPETANVDLGAYKGHIINIRWWISGYTYWTDGWYIDDIVVTGS